MIPIIDEDMCLGCENCVEACPPTAIYMDGGKAKIDERLCEECGECVPECPEKAITIPWGVDLGHQFDEVVEKARTSKLEDLSKDI